MRQSRETLQQQLKADTTELQRTGEHLNRKDDKPPPSLSVNPKAWQPILEAQQPGSHDIFAKILRLYLGDSRELVDTLLAALATGIVRPSWIRPTG